jgi:hypothetical protein
MNNLVKSIVLFLAGILAGINGTYLFGNAPDYNVPHNERQQAPATKTASTTVPAMN